MKITERNKDYVELNEQNIDDFIHIEKVHLIKLVFDYPTRDLLNEVLKKYKNTNRFVISDNIKFYNDFLKRTNKKYYVENTEKSQLISFFRKNNKVLLNFDLLDNELKECILDNLLKDILQNLEVIALSKDDFEKYKEILSD